MVAEHAERAARTADRIPYVRLKVAISLDGHTALLNGSSKWITGEQARMDGHAWRAKADAIVTGIGTVLADDPLLNVRLVGRKVQPTLAIVDSKLRTPPNARLFDVPDREVLVYTTQAAALRRPALKRNNACIVALPEQNGQVNLAAMVADLTQRGLSILHVEAGSTLNGAFLNNGLVDELVIYVGPQLLGRGLPLAQLEKLTSLDHATRLEFVSADMVGDDIRVVARVVRR
ncbi:RibD family protein [Xylophilus sp. Leaf220]|uniref:RibD family protein n=1 Tax=Xylophilus sp. Leaf220 TaxID=1735686 RepID=UPI0009EB21F4|nr:RibD family protein [Xylophilus sp. Leaf220]